MGRDKALLPWPPGAASGTLLAAMIQALGAVADAVTVVAGANAAALAPIAAAGQARLVVNPAPERGQFSSLQAGLRAVCAERQFAAVLITPVDCAPLRPASLVQLVAALPGALARGGWAVAPQHGGRHGHPLLAAPELIAALLAAPVDSSAQQMLRAQPARIVHLAVPDSLAQCNTPSDYSKMGTA